MQPENDLFDAEILRATDGDTIVANVEIPAEFGLAITATTSFRLQGINAPEMKGESKVSGEASRAYLMRLIEAHSGGTNKIKLKPHRKRLRDKYGRFLVVLFAGGLNLNQKMLDDGYAKPFMEDA